MKPIEKTTRVIRRLAATLFLLSKEDAEQDQGEDFDVLETDFVEKVVAQLNTFFSVGKKERAPPKSPAADTRKVHPTASLDDTPHRGMSKGIRNHECYPRI